VILGLRSLTAVVAGWTMVLRLRLCAGVIVGVALASAAGQSLAQPAKRWVQASQADFESGKRENVALTSIGELQLGRKKQNVVEKAGDQVWALAIDSRGVVYAATGSDGTIYRIAGDKSELFYNSEEAEILCLAVDEADNLYAGTAPNGLIYKFGPKGEVDVFLDSEEPYVWGLAFDAGGALYAATGDHGKLLKIEKKGESKTVFETDKPHLLDVVTDSKNNAYVCTSVGGLVFRIGPDGKVFALFDSEDDEMHKLAIDENDNLYVCTADGMQPGTVGIGPRGEMPEQPPGEVQPGPAEAIEADEADGGEEPEEDAGMPPPGPPPGPPPAPRPPDAVAPAIEGINFVYKITPEGMVTSIFRREGMALLSMVCRAGSVYVGTANEGQILKIDDDLQVTILAQVEQPQIASLAAAPDGTLYFGTAGEGKVYRLSNELATEGTFISMAKDMAFPSRWGIIRYAGDAVEGVSVATRTGNVTEPDDTWSDWSKEQSDPAGVKIASPAGRFFQYRLLLKAAGKKTPTIRSVEMYYLPPNYRPRIMAITFPPPGDAEPPAESPPTGSVAASQKGTAAPMRGSIQISWQAEDPNGDRLEFEAFFKGAGEANWKSIADALAEPMLTWSTVRVPDGVYRVKVKAADAPSNPPGRSMATEEITEPFIIDNTPPVVSDIKAKVGDGRKVEVTARLVDTTSPIQNAVYSIDSGDWIMLSPEDGIFDSPRETVKFATEAMDPGEHTVVINTRDAAGNVGAGKETVVVPGE